MHLLIQFILLTALGLTIVPGLKTIAKAQHPIPSPIGIPLTLPKCAQPIQRRTLRSLGCKASDAKCMCSKTEWLPLLLGAITHACGAKDRETAKQFGAAYCGLNPKNINPAMPKITTLPGQPPVKYTCSPIDGPLGEKAKSTMTIHSTVQSTVLAGTKTSTKTTTMKTTKTSTSKPTKGSINGLIGAASRVGTRLSAVALIGVIAAVGLTFAEF